MTPAQRVRQWDAYRAERKAGAAQALDQAHQDVAKALRRLAQRPDSLLHQRSLKDAITQEDRIKAEFNAA
jgi:hypothetical protein